MILNLLSQLVRGGHTFLRVFSPSERWLLLVSLIAIVLSAFWLLIKPNQILGEDRGKKIFTEGVIASSQSEINQHLTRLTKIGLVRFDENQGIAPAIARSWRVSDDGREYTFELADQFSAESVAQALKKQRNGLDQVTIEQPSPNTLVIKLAQPYSFLLEELTRPIIDAGPFKILSQDANQVTLEPNPDFVFGRPRLDKVIIMIFHDQASLHRSLKRSQVDAALNVDRPQQLKNFQTITLTLPRRLVLFFNLDNSAIPNQENRQKLARSETVEQQNLTITLLNSDLSRQSGQKVKEALDRLGLNTTLEFIDSKVYHEEVLPNRRYQATLTLVDFGPSEDPYVFWHSSQTGRDGQNLSQLKSPTVDRSLEAARLAQSEGQQREALNQLDEALKKIAPAVFYDQFTLQYTLSEKIAGAVFGPTITPADRFFNIWQWEIKK